MLVMIREPCSPTLMLEWQGSDPGPLIDSSSPLLPQRQSLTGRRSVALYRIAAYRAQNESSDLVTTAV